MTDPVPDHRLDATGLLCPEPVLRARLALSQMQSGEVLEVIATDPLAEVDLTVFCERAGHRLISAAQRAGKLTCYIRKA